MTSASTRNDPDRDDRRGLFDVLVRRSGWILAAFYVVWVLLAGLLTCARILTAENPPLAWLEIVIIGIVSAAITVGIALPITFGLVEGTNMVLAELRKRLWREEAREEGREEGRKEGSAETQTRWQGWNERRLAAEREGLPFTEPPPALNGNSTENPR